MKDYAVFSLRLTNILANKGFQIVRSKVNYKNPQFLVYYFEDTPELREAINFYKNNKTN